MEAIHFAFFLLSFHGVIGTGAVRDVYKCTRIDDFGKPFNPADVRGQIFTGSKDDRFSLCRAHAASVAGEANTDLPYDAAGYRSGVFRIHPTRISYVSGVLGAYTVYGFFCNAPVKSFVVHHASDGSITIYRENSDC